MPPGDAAKIRRLAMQLVQEARCEGKRYVNIRMGQVRDTLELTYDNALTDIRQVLETEIFGEQDRVEFVRKTGPNQGVNTIYRFRIL